MTGPHATETKANRYDVVDCDKSVRIFDSTTGMFIASAAFGHKSAIDQLVFLANKAGSAL